MHAASEPASTSEQPAAADAAGRTVQQFLKDVGLFFAAPFVTLAYLVLFPFIAVVLLARTGRQARRRRTLTG
ncbi:MAG TPA: hypothetical protein VMU82_00375 [Acetobacteraceae bacterium]|nr:hypothetical protein [Acetobacteraceae bacterium]